MEALVQALGRFANRDLPYLIGGLSLLIGIREAFLLDVTAFPFTYDLKFFVFLVAIAYPYRIYY